MTGPTGKTPAADPTFAGRYGPWAVVTGASDGIGRALALALASRGLNLILVARRADRLEAVAEIVRTYGVAALVIPADLARPTAWDIVLDAAAAHDVGLLVAAAGFGTSGPLLEGYAVTDLVMVSVNCTAVRAQPPACEERFTARGRGGIVLMGSLLGFQGVPGAAAYAATKAFVQTLAEGLRPELRRAGVDVLAVAPGPVRSGFADRAGLRMGLALPAAAVAGPILSALGRRTTVRPGWLSWLLEAAFIGQPRSLRSRILARVMAGMIPPRGRDHPAATTPGGGL